MERRSLGIWARAGFVALLSSAVGACTPVTREFPSGQGGSGGFAGGCEPGTSESCYSGTPGTEGVGVCKKGTHTCLPDGTGYGACEGEVIPTAEICTTPIDEACDGPNPIECPSLGHAWSESFGGMGEDIATTIAVDPATGDVIATGYFRNTIDLGGGPMASTGGNDIFLVRLSADGQHRWSKRFGDADSQYAHGLAIDASGAIYLVGDIYGSIDFGDGKPVTSKGSKDAFVAKFDPDGKVIWSRLFGDDLSQEAKAVAITPTNQVVVAGNFSGFIQLMGMELPSNNSRDMFVIKLDASGFDVGAKKYGSPMGDDLFDMAVDSTGAVLLAGGFTDIVDFGSLGTFPTAGDDDAFVLKLNADLSEAWVRIYGDMQAQRAGTVVTSSNDDIFVMGDFTGSIMLEDGTSLTSAPQERSVFMVSVTATGKHRWAKSTGNGQTLYARQMLVSDPSSQAIVAAGFYDGSFDFGGGPIQADIVDAFITKIGWDGTHISSARFGGPQLDGFFDVAVAPTGDIFVSGLHQGPADFGGGLLEAPAGPNDIQALLMRLLP